VVVLRYTAEKRGGRSRPEDYGKPRSGLDPGPIAVIVLREVEAGGMGCHFSGRSQHCIHRPLLHTPSTGHQMTMCVR